MEISTVVSVLLITVVKCEPLIDSYRYRNEASQFGELLRPPPPPPIPIIPVPFHGGTLRSQHQNTDFNYQYQLPPPPQSPVPSITAHSDFKFPAPFYRQYNFDFVPQPQPFTSTPSPSIFQKVSQWLFPSQQTGDDINSGSSISSYSIPPSKKDCNPCNFAPWIPVIRYDLTKNNRENIKQGTGSPHTFASSNGYNTIQNLPQRFSKQTDQSQFSTDGSHATYGVPKQTFGENNNYVSMSSTYGPPSPTHTVTIPHETPLSTHTFSSTNPFVTTSYDVSSNSYIPSSSYHYTKTPGLSSSSFSSNVAEYVSKSTTQAPSFSNYKSQILNNISPNNNNLDFSSTLNPSNELQLPKIEQPSQFKNSYGEPIVNTYALDIPYSVSAAGAESLKVKTKVLPDSKPISRDPNVSIALANPAPFSLNKGRNIHTLQPVALPNLSVSPLPPIFNARPFRPYPPKYTTNDIKSINFIDQHLNNVNIAKSIPISEFVHSIEYPTTVVQSPIIDIDTIKAKNHTKAYRNIPNRFIIDDIRDISPQASEDHVSAANAQPDASFESTGLDYASDIYDTGLPTELKQFGVPSNHKPVFADLRGLKDEDIDKYRTENNLQDIDSPLLYLKPSAPHKNFANFVISSTPRNTHEYEIYDESATTEAPQESTHTSAWDESRTYFAQDISPPKEQQNINRAKVVQIIVPYTNSDQENNNYYDIKDWPFTLEKEVQARKVQTHTEMSIYNTTTETYESSISTTEQPMPVVTEYYNSDHMNTQPNDVYDVKEPPFDIIKLQHTIDSWTQQEYSKDYKMPEGTRSIEKYAKQIPDEFFTTLGPINNTPTDNYNYSYDIYDHEGSSSIQYLVKQNRTNSKLPKPFMQYNFIERKKINHQSGKNEDHDKLHIYTAASKFRKLTTTPPPWGQIHTSISPLTKEKVYVVTSKPWREKSNFSNEYQSDTKVDSKSSEDIIDNLPFKSPRFSNRPSIGDQSHIFSKGWHQTINNLESRIDIGSSSNEDSSKGDEKEDEEPLTSDETRR